MGSVGSDRDVGVPRAKRDRAPSLPGRAETGPAARDDHLPSVTSDHLPARPTGLERGAVCGTAFPGVGAVQGLNKV